MKKKTFTQYLMVFLALFFLALTVNAQKTIVVNLTSDSADVEEDIITGDMYFDSGDLELGRDGNPQLVGLRWENVPIPVGATITEAYIQFTCDETNDAEDPITLIIWADASDNADTLKWHSENAFNLSSREKTNAIVEWSPVPWMREGAAADSQKTTDISTVIAEVVGRDGWENGNALCVIISAQDTSNLYSRWAESFGGDDLGAVLHVTYEGGEPTLPIIWEPGFESDTVLTGIRPGGELIWRDWGNSSINTDPAYVYSGSKSLKTGPLDGGRNQYVFGFTPGSTISLFAWATIDDVSPRTQHAYIGFRNYIAGHIKDQEVDSRVEGETTINDPGVWVRIRACMTLPAEATEVLVFFWYSGDTDPGPSIYIDDLEFKLGDSCNVTKVKEIKYNSTVNVYPNPTEGPVQITFGRDITGVSSIEVFDVTGKVVSRLNNLSGRENAELDLSSYAAGVYFGMVKAQSRTYSFKIIKK